MSAAKEDESVAHYVYDNLESGIKQALDGSHLNKDQRKRVLDQLKRYMDSGNAALRAVLYHPEEKGALTLGEEYRQSDALRKLMSELQLPPLAPDADALLQPPPQSRLGVYISLDARELPLDYKSGLLIPFAATGSRAEKIGIKPWDVIEQINAQSIESVGELRQAVEACQSGMVIEVLRAGEHVTLTEKIDAAPERQK